MVIVTFFLKLSIFQTPQRINKVQIPFIIFPHKSACQWFNMVELRVTVDEKLNKLLDKIVESGIYQSKAELMRAATIDLLIKMGVLKEHIRT